VTAEQPQPLPVRLRPGRGETIESYIRRLARANHLKPSYLRRYLCGPDGYYSKPQPQRLAALSGRSRTALEHAFADNARPQHETRPARHVQRLTPSKAAVFRAIRRDAVTESLSIRALAQRHHVHRRTVRQALASPEPPARKQPSRKSPALDPLKPAINTLITQDLTVIQIWEYLMDEHDAVVSYATVRDYITNHRSDVTTNR
jgi:hypothetical protein